jgi:hypothetical protein
MRNEVLSTSCTFTAMFEWIRLSPTCRRGFGSESKKMDGAKVFCKASRCRSAQGP